MNTYSYALTDLAGNTANNSFSVYRLPDVSNISFAYTGTSMIVNYTSDIATPVELSYTSPSGTGSITLASSA